VWNVPASGAWLPAAWLWTAETAPAADKVITLKNNGVAFATVSFAAGSNAGVVALTGAAAYSRGDKVTFHAPAVADAAMANVAGTVVATTTG
jgi:aspartate 1-decarboxylase